MGVARMGRPKDGMTKRKLAAAELLGQGLENSEVMAELNIPKTTLWRWQQEDIFCDAVALASYRFLMRTVPQARQLLKSQMRDDNRWLAQNAANSILRERGAVEGNAAQQVVVSFMADVVPGMPEDISEEGQVDA